MIDGLINLVILAIVLSVLVLAHEFGHFVAARRAGVTVHEFGIGFPPRALILGKRGETTYTLNWLPIGGFVRMEGEEVSPADGTETDAEREARAERDSLPEKESVDPHAFVNQTLGTRLRILGAGVVVNFVIAWIIFTLIAFAAQPTWRIQMASVTPGSPADVAGFVGGQPTGETAEIRVYDADGEPTGETEIYHIPDDTGDTILAIDGTTFEFFDDLSRAQDGSLAGPLQYLAERPSQTVVVTVQHADGSIEDIEATLNSREAIEARQGALGFIPRYGLGEQQNGLLESVVIGFQRTIETSTLILRAVVGIFLSLFDGPGDALDEVAGPLGMIDVVGQVRTSLPPVFMLWFVGMISANLAVINLLPIPPLDGSRMLMGVVQAVSGDRVSPETERLVYFTGWVALMVFLVLVTFSDLQRMLT